MLKGKVGFIPIFFLGMFFNGVLTAQDKDGDFQTRIKEGEEKVIAYAKEKGLTVGRGEEGHLRLQDSNGKIIEPPQDLLPPRMDEAASDLSDKGLENVGTKEPPDAQGNPPQILGN